MRRRIGASILLGGLFVAVAPVVFAADQQSANFQNFTSTFVPTVVNTLSPNYKIYGAVEPIVGTQNSPNFHYESGIPIGQDVVATTPTPTPAPASNGIGGLPNSGDRQNQVVTGGPEADGLTLEFTYPTFLSQKVLNGTVPTGAERILINGSSDGVTINGNRYQKTMPLFLGVNVLDAQADYGNGHLTGKVTATLERLLIGDMNRDGRVDEVDLSLFTRAWKANFYVFMGDFNEDGRVDDADLALLVSNWTGSGAPVAPVVGGADVKLSAPSQVNVGDTFQVKAEITGATDVDVVRLVGSFSDGLLKEIALAKGSVLDQLLPKLPAGQLSTGSFSLTRRVNGTGLVAVWTFKALKPGLATVALDQGSRVLSSGMDEGRTYGQVQIRIGEAPIPAEETNKIIFLSTTHPQEDSWYQARRVQVDWQLPVGLDIKRQYIGFDQAPAGKAEVLLGKGDRNFEETLPNDGVWYVHLSVELANGTILRETRRIQVDSEVPPPFVVTVDQTEVPNQVPNTAHFSTRDNESGIKTYEVFLDGVFVTSTHDTSWALPTVEPGDHTVRVRVTDEAGNIQEASASYRVTKFRPAPVAREFVTGWYWFFYGLMFVGLGFAFIFFVKRRKKKKLSPKRR